MNFFVRSKVLSFLCTLTSPDRNMLFASRPSMFNSTLSPGLVHSLMMHLHSEHFLSVRIQNLVRWQEYNFFAWLHKLHSSTSLDLSEWGTSNFLAPAVFLYGALVLLFRCGRHLLGRRISRLGIPATHCESVCFIHCTSSRSGSWRASPLYRPCVA